LDAAAAHPHPSGPPRETGGPALRGPGTAGLRRLRLVGQTDPRGGGVRARPEGRSLAARRRRDPPGATAAARRTVPGRAAGEVLSEVVPREVSTLTFPKTMRWGAGERVFVRPVRGLLALLGGAVTPMEVLGVASSAVTAGHRILADGDFEVRGVEDYLAKLREN